MTEPVFFASAQAFGEWLEAHAGQSDELLVGLHKVDSGQPSMTWPESVDEALCHGWIDGVRRRIDDTRYSIRFTPRRPGSIWSAINIAKVEKLQATGRMTPAGLAAFAQRTEGKSRIYSYEQTTFDELSADELKTFKRDKAAWRYFENAPPGYKRQMLHRITSAKRPETRASRLARLIEASAAGLRLE